MFDSSGLTDDLLTVYRALLQRPELGRATRHHELATEIGQSEGETSQQLQRLRDLGFVVQSWVEGVEYALDPALTFRRLAEGRQREIDAQSEELRSDQLAASQFTSDLANFLVQRKGGDVEILEGRELANQRMHRFQPQKSSWGLIQDPGPLAWDPDNYPDRQHLERGVEMRSIYPESILKRPRAHGLLQFIGSLGGKIRIAPSIPFRLIIFDNESAVMAIDPDNNASGAVVHHGRAVVRMATDLYLSYWDRGFDPLEGRAPRSDDEISAQEAEFLRLLVHGATDEQVGRKLGVSLRTVRRIAAKLSEQVGASGRFELGVRAAQRGWVD